MSGNLGKIGRSAPIIPASDGATRKIPVCKNDNFVSFPSEAPKIAQICSYSLFTRGSPAYPRLPSLPRLPRLPRPPGSPGCLGPRGTREQRPPPPFGDGGGSLREGLFGFGGLLDCNGRRGRRGTRERREVSRIGG